MSLFFFGTKTFRLDKGRAEKKALIRLENKVFTPLKTSHERTADVFRKFELGVNLSQTPFPATLTLPAALKTQIQFKAGMKYIGIAPFAQHASKTYPLDLMKAVLLKLSKTPNVQLLLFGGGKEEVTVLNALEEKIPNVQCMAGKLKLKDELLSTLKDELLEGFSSSSIRKLSELIRNKLVPALGRDRIEVE